MLLGLWTESSNFGIPIAAVADLTGKPAEKINGRMTGALVIYSATFMRYAWSMTLLPCTFVCVWLLYGVSARVEVDG